MAEDKKEETKKVLTSEKTAGLKKTLDALNVKNAQAMKLLDEKYAVKNEVGRKKRNIAPVFADRGLAQLGSSLNMKMFSGSKMPAGYQRPKS